MTGSGCGPRTHTDTPKPHRLQESSEELFENEVGGGKALWEQLRKELSKVPGEPDLPAPLEALVGRTPLLEAADAYPF